VPPNPGGSRPGSPGVPYKRPLYLLKALQKEFCGRGATFSQKLVPKGSSILQVSWWSIPPRPHTRMPPRGRNSKELTWSWAYSTGHPASDRKLEAAAHAAWPYAFLCAWTYLNDHDAAVDLMDHAVHNASQYLARLNDPSDGKLTARIKSVIRRRARQLAAKRSREMPSGSMRDMEQLHVGHPEVEQRAYARQLFSRLSPTAQSIFDWRWLGYSWREIGGNLEMDHSAVRRAYFRELGLMVRSLSPPGESPKCG
jgi:DNA-directed RNA polymerase specialized sigma24 family protein